MAQNSTSARVLIVANKTAATPGLIEAVRRRAAAGPVTFSLLVPNPDQLRFDRNGRDVHVGEQVLELARPLLEEAAGADVNGRVATSPNAYDDIVNELDERDYDEILLSTLPSHVSHWLHVDLPKRVGELGYPVTTVTPDHEPATFTPTRPAPVKDRARSLGRRMLNKVPEVTAFFWIIKVLATTVGETAADNLNSNLKLGLTGTTYVMTAILVVVLIHQFRLRRYVPGVYWLAVVLISIVGTLITDNLVDNFGVPLQTTTIAFSIALAITFAVWYGFEKTLSIHTIYTRRREAFYWGAVLFTFALGTAAGDLVAEKLNLGYWKSALMFGAVIGVVYLAHVRFKLNAILAFWIAYILTRPLGASIGDYLSQPRSNDGLGLGTTGTSVIFLATILAVVTYLTITRRDRIESDKEERAASGPVRAVVEGAEA